MNIKELLRYSGLALIVFYISGFIAWNFYLSHFGFFEFDLIQTRFFSAGILVLFLPTLLLGFVEKIRSWFVFKNIYLIIVIFLLWTTLFSLFFFPHIPQYLGGAKPYLISIWGNKDMQESFTIAGLSLNFGATTTIETKRACKLYENVNSVLVTFASDFSYGDTLLKYNLKGVRVLAVQKENILAIATLPKKENSDFNYSEEYKVFCTGIRDGYNIFEPTVTNKGTPTIFLENTWPF